MRTQIAELNSQQFFFFSSGLSGTTTLAGIQLYLPLVPTSLFLLPGEGGERERPNKENLKRLLLITDFYLPTYRCSFASRVN